MGRIDREASAPTGCERTLLFCHVVFYRGLRGLGGGAQRERAVEKNLTAVPGPPSQTRFMTFFFSECSLMPLVRVQRGGRTYFRLLTLLSLSPSLLPLFFIQQIF